MSVRIELEERGDGQPVVFIHGLTFDRRLLLDASEPIFATRRARRIYLDLPGHGESPPDERAASAEGLVAALVERLAGLEAPILVGHSYGAYLALGVATQRPVAGLALVTPVLEPDLARRRVPERRVASRDRELPFGDERATFEEIAVQQSAGVLSAYQRLVHPASERTHRPFLEAVRARYVLPTPILARLEPRPTLILCGRDDHWVGYEDALAFVRALPDSELVVLPGCGQLLPIEAAARYEELLSGFLSLLLG